MYIKNALTNLSERCSCTAYVAIACRSLWSCGSSKLFSKCSNIHEISTNMVAVRTSLGLIVHNVPVQKHHHIKNCDIHKYQQ